MINYLDLYFDGALKGSFNPSSGNYTPLSDARAKTNISAMSSILPTLMNLSPKKYNYKTNLNKSCNGFLAHDIQRLFPDIVSESPSRDGSEFTLLVDYAQLSVLAINAIQEQQKNILQQEKLLQGQALRMDRIEQKLNSLE